VADVARPIWTTVAGILLTDRRTHYNRKVAAAFTVTLKRTDGRRRVAVASGDATEGTTDVASDVPADWATPQTVTITGVDDLDGDGDVASQQRR
jgi:hypothetical protein